MRNSSDKIAEAFKLGKKVTFKTMWVLIENGQVVVKFLNVPIVTRKCRTQELIIINDNGFSEAIVRNTINTVLSIYGSKLWIKETNNKWYLSDGTAWNKQTDNYFYFKN